MIARVHCRWMLLTLLGLDACVAPKLASAQAKGEPTKSQPARPDNQSQLMRNTTFEDADRAYAQASAEPVGPGKNQRLRAVASMYVAAVRSAPAQGAAPSAAVRVALLWVQLGELNHAMEIATFFLQEGGSEPLLAALQEGILAKHVAPSLDEYRDRVGALLLLRELMAALYVQSSMFDRAVVQYEAVAITERFDRPARARAARIAMELHARAGNQASAAWMRDVLKTLTAPPSPPP